MRLMDGRDCAYVYDRETLLTAARAVKGVKSAARVLYAMKANPHPQILQLFHAQGLDFDCVSRGEIEHLLRRVPQIDRSRILYTPNFIGRDEYPWAFEQGVQVTLDSPFPSRAGRSCSPTRICSCASTAASAAVITAMCAPAGSIPSSAFRSPIWSELADRVRAAGARVIGLHSHSGSGILDVSNWEQTAELLTELARRFPDVQTSWMWAADWVSRSAPVRPIRSARAGCGARRASRQ